MRKRPSTTLVCGWVTEEIPRDHGSSDVLAYCRNGLLPYICSVIHYEFEINN